ncbi:MAG: hypothetical protein Q4D16_10935 [Eubacteriales bacterium]|nr:hypothetical protein [Eubacteriales bacterium]
MKKRGLDERQEQVAAKIGALSFYVMFGVCLLVILGELIWKGNLESVIGETIVFVAGGITCLIGCIRNGIWNNTGKDMTIGQNLLESVICSGIFSVLYALILSRKVGDSVNVGKYAVFFFIGIFILCFICLMVLGKLARSRKEKQEEKYSD